MFERNIFAQLFPYVKKQQQMQPVVNDPSLNEKGVQIAEDAPEPPQQPPLALRTMAGQAPPAEQAQPEPEQPQQPIAFDPAMLPDHWGDPSYVQAYPNVGINAPNPTLDMPSTWRPEVNTSITPKNATTTPKSQPMMPDYSALDPSNRALKEAEWNSRYAQNQDHGWKGRLSEILQNFLFGMSHAGPNTDWKAALALGGIGAAGGLANRSANERRNAERDIPQLRRQVDFENDQRYKQAQTANEQNKPIMAKMEADRRARKDEINAKYNDDRIRLGKDKADELKYWREQRIELMDRGLDQKDRQMDQVDRKIAELERSNKADEAQAAANEAGRNARFGTGQANSMAKATITSADKARAVLASIEKNAPDGATPEQIAAKKAEFLNTLTPEVKKQIGQ